MISFVLQASSSSAAPLGTRAVLVSFGARGGHYRLFKNENIPTFDTTELLLVLQSHEFFGAELQGVALTKCMVYVALGESKSKPATNDTLLKVETP